MKYKVGDKVMVRQDLKAGMDITFGVSEPMARLAGRIATITRVLGTGYGIDIDDTGFSWHDDMFEPVAVVVGKSRNVRLSIDSNGTCHEIPVMSDQMHGHRHLLPPEFTYEPIETHCSYVKIGELREMTVAKRRITPMPNEIETRKEIRKRLLKL